eukprot:SM000001S04548  [mRNA]  locus=s1:798024:802055:- [translate_table: standard]
MAEARQAPATAAASAAAGGGMYEAGLARSAANHVALSPLAFLERAARVFPTRPAVVHGSRVLTWADELARARRMASALRRRGVGDGHTVAFVAPNIPALYEAHFGVPMAGAVLNAINLRLDSPTIAHFLDHGEAKLIFVDSCFLKLVTDALQLLTKDRQRWPPIVVIQDKDVAGGCQEDDLLSASDTEYEAFLEEGDQEYAWNLPDDEWQAIALNYTSGTTSTPKGVVYHHRGAYLNALANALSWEMRVGAVYLWTLPMFHCNGWCFPWTLAALAGTNICLRNVTAEIVYAAIAQHKVTHFCGAPVVLNMLASSLWGSGKLCKQVDVLIGGAPPSPAILTRMKAAGFCVTHAYGLTETFGPASVCVWKLEWDALPPDRQAQLKALVLNMLANAGVADRGRMHGAVEVMTAGAAPPSQVIRRVEEIGFHILHAYGLTETYGPCVMCVWKDEWDPLPAGERGRLKARQGVCHLGQFRMEVMDPKTMQPVPADGESIGEIMLRGNVTMKGYLKNESATREATKGGWLHSGDLAVMHPDGYVEIMDRSKDIIISGGENISSLEVESALYKHPAVLEAAVVARPDDIWGETPCAFVALKDCHNGESRSPKVSPAVSQEALAKDLIDFCRAHMAHYKVPKSVIFGELPKTSTGKIQKFILRDRVRHLGKLPGLSRL